MYRNNFSKIIGFVLLIMIISGFTVLETLQNPQFSSHSSTLENEDYMEQWSKVDSLIKLGLPQSALEITEIIYEDARTSGNSPQFIKAVLYTLRLTAEYEEEFMEKTITHLEDEISKADQPTQQVLHSIQADLYWRYFQANRYKFYNRTTVVGMDQDDLRTWDLKTMLDVIINHYEQSLLNSDLLKSTKLEDFNAILDTSDNSKLYRPSLYDFLAHRAIDFFMNDESSITQPAYRFELKELTDFASPQQFTRNEYITRDSLSLKFYALQILQELTQFHLNDDDDFAAMIDLNLKRLEFVWRNSILPNKDSLYINSLQNFEQDVITSVSSTEVSYQLASAYHRLSLKYKPLVSDDFKWDAKKAVEICESAIDRFPQSNGALQCENLLGKIQAGTFNLTIEKENIPGNPMLSLLQFKNLDKIYLRIVKLDYSDYRTMIREIRHRKELIEKLVAMPAVAEWGQDLPNEGDFQSHHTEIELPGMEAGHYFLLGSMRDNFTPDTNTITYQTMWVTRIGFISQNDRAGNYGFYLMDREKGTALKDVDVKMFYREYDYSSRSYKYTEGGSYVSDSEGYFEIPPLAQKARPNSFFLEFRTKDDHYITGDRFYHSGRSIKKERTVEKIHLFTDRAIYRPGQTVYFKGILLEKSGQKTEILEDKSVHVELIDVNHQKVTELDLTSNDYGSVQGSFIIPQGLLNGRMTIKTKSGSVSFQVEEYKRPNFEVSFNPLEGSYKLGEELVLSGNAKAFAGNNISMARVSYRVVREVFYPWRFNYIRFFPLGTSMEITNGTTISDEDGLFNIPFTAIPDHSIPQEYQPAFRYTVYADITDMNNETQSGFTTVSVGYKALKIMLDLGEVENLNEFSSIPFQTTNLNDQPVPASGNIEIALLEEPDRLLREQLWQHPDVYVLDEENFHSEFPLDSYKDENDPENLNIKAVVFSRSFNTQNDSVFKFENVKSWKPGRYKVKVITKDEYGTDVELIKYFILFNPESKTAPLKELNWFHVLKSQCEPGENARFLVGTADTKVRLLYEVIHKEKVISSQWISLSKEQRLIEIPVVEDFRGGFKVNLLFVKHNRVFKNNFGVNVPYTNKMLDFEFVTFRDKLIPGQNEEWMIKVKGKTGDQVAAELLAGMYDVSLDKFTSHSWPFNIFTNPFHGRNWNTENAFQSTSGSKSFSTFEYTKPPSLRYYDQLNWFGFNYFGRYNYMRNARTDMMTTDAMPGKAMLMDGTEETEDLLSLEMESEDTVELDGVKVVKDSLGGSQIAASQEGLKVRRDFRETAFFFPQLKTDENGDVLIKFTAPESLTRWKLMGLAHTKDLKFGSFVKEIETSKELMVIPNAPRFFRERDSMWFSAKVVNLSEEKIEGKVNLKFFNSLTGEEISGSFAEELTDVSFSVEKGGSAPVSWAISIPDQFDVISYRIMAQGGTHSDGEEKPIPVLSNRMLVTETLPLPINGNETKEFKFKKLINSGNESSLKNHKLTLEFSSNPAWYAVQALPYMMEGTRESADNIFNRFYANSIAAYIVKSNPKIKQVFDAWKQLSPDAFLSNLEKNQELKALILAETPWVRDARNESERKQRIAVLFDFNKMADEQEQALYKLLKKQSPGGGWSWYKGMPENRNITQHIVTGFGRLKQLGVFDAMEDQKTKSMITKAIRYLDKKIRDDYDWLSEHKSDLTKNHLGNLQIQYLFSRSFFMNELSLSKKAQTAYDYYFGQATKFWTSQGNYQKAMIALALSRGEESDISNQILASLKEHALYSEEMGMYWRNNSGGYYWYQAPIETQAMLIEAFYEVLDDIESVEKMKIWLLKQKQTQDWKTARATADAVYALLLRGGDWLATDNLALISVGGQEIDPFSLEDTKVEAGTGYFKTSWTGKEITPDMGKVSITNENNTIAWGGMYWQYFEDLDKITFAETPLKLDKKLFVKRNTESGPVIMEIEKENVSVGDVLIVRIELRVDRDLEYVHMKDMRASALEPVNVVSGYHYQGGLGYYESTLDASTNFFFDYLRKGTYVFEYPLIVSQKGDFSNGVTTIQCMYAPEFTSHSEGVRIVVE